MTTQAKCLRTAIYTLLALLVVLLPMTGWFARGVNVAHISPQPQAQHPYIRCEGIDKQKPLFKRCERNT